MADRRQTRPTPQEVKAGPDGNSYWAKPLPWRKRNDLGDKITRSYVEAINKSLRASEVDGTVTFTGGYRENMFDWEGCLTTAYPEVSLEELELLDIFEIRELLVASCVANGLEVEYMIDPNFLDPKVLEAAAEGDPTAGQKTTSLEDSGDSDTQSQS